MGIGQDLQNSIAGNTETAVIKIHDCRKTAASGIADMAALSDVLKSGLPPAAAGCGEQLRSFPVQFNPSELEITVTGDQIEKMDIQGKVETDVPEPPKEKSGSMSMVHAELSVKLIFDRVVNQDAFLSDKMNLTGTKGVAGNISVQPEVEGLIAALQNCYTRVVTFQWGDFTFTGSLETVQAEYTMFSPSGNPIRANVSLDISQDRADGTLMEWRSQYDRIMNLPT